MESFRQFERLSWRDPDGFVLKVGDRIFRAVTIDKQKQTRELISSTWISRLIEDGTLPRTAEVSEAPILLEQPNRWLWLEHHALPFPCHAHEITALQLYDSAELTLKIAIEAARHGWMLKDASSWNVLHSGGRAVFVDFSSFDMATSNGTWMAYGQFVRHFVLPLLLHRKLAVTPADVFLTNRDGVTPEHAYRLLHGRGTCSLTALEHVLLPKMLARAGSRLIAAESTGRSKPIGTRMGQDPIFRTLERLQRTLEKLRPDPSAEVQSVWGNYEEDRTHYSIADLSAKKDFVSNNLPGNGRVLDLGCNAGEFSLLAAEQGNRVVAADFDHPALSRLYSRVRGRESLVTPAFVNIGRPTPAIGWRNLEIASFLDRSAGQFDCILMLGLIHHLLVSERATISMLVELLVFMRPQRVILEWVDPADPKFRQLAGLNAALYSYLNVELYESVFMQKFQLAAKCPLPCGTRIMYQWAL